MPKTRTALDHFIGQTVERVEIVGQADHEWGIVLVSGAEISNKDGRKKTMPEIKGLQLLSVVPDYNGYILKFGTVQLVGGEPQIVDAQDISISRNLYGIADPGVEGEDEVDPEAEAVSELPPDPSPERVVGGPESAVEGE